MNLISVYALHTCMGVSNYLVFESQGGITVVPALGDPRRERPPAVYGHVINFPTHFNVPIRPSDERPPAMYGHFCLVPRVSVHDRYYCTNVMIMQNTDLLHSWNI